MSTDLSSQPDGETRPVSTPVTKWSAKSAAISFGVSVTVLLVFWYTIGRPMYQNAKLAVETQKAQEDLKRTLDSSQQETDRLAATVKDLKTDMSSSLQGSYDEVRGRFEKIEENLLEIGKGVGDLQVEIEKREASRARALATVTGVSARGKDVRDRLKTLDDTLQSWSKKYEPLLTNDTGKRIAASEKHLTRLAVLLEKDRPTSRQVAAWHEQLDQLLAPLERAARDRDGSLVVAEEHVEAIETIAQQVREKLTSLEDDVLVLDAVLAETKEIPPGDATLRSALAQFRQQQAEIRVARVAAARSAAEEEATKALEKAEQERIVEATRVKEEEIHNDIARLQVKQKELREAGDKEREALEQALAREKLLREFENDLPEIKSLLLPFITPHLMQIGTNRFTRSGNYVRMSIGRIGSFGALKETDEGLERLHYLGGSRENWRENVGAFPRYSPKLIQRDDRARKQVARAQELLRKYGTLMAEKGYLRE